MYILPPGSDTEVNCEDITSDFHFLQDDSDPLLTNNYGTDDGLDGATYAFQQRAQNVVNAKFKLQFSDWYDYQMKKHTLAKFFVQKGLYRIRTDSEPAIVKYVYAGNFTVAPTEDGSNTALITIPFDNPSGLKYSLGYSDDVMDYDHGLWQMGMNLPMNKSLQYEYNATRSFQIYNASDIEVNPIQHHDLQVIVKNTTGQVRIENSTTGTHVSYTGTLTTTDQLVWDGVNLYLNGNLANNSTDFTYLTLAPGYNDIKIISTADLDIDFHFRFIYLN
jgi:hypothetical protein